MATLEPNARIPASREVRPRRFRTVLFTLLPALLGFGVIIYLGTRLTAANAGHSSIAAPPPPKVTVAPVEQQVLVERRELLGRVDSVETVEIRPRVSGHIQEVRLQAGEIVRKDDVLFVIDPRWYRAQFDLATANVERAKARAENAAREARRSGDLLKSRTISTEEAETRDSALAEARAELLAAEANLATARLDLEYTEVRAPITGRVSRAYVTAGNRVSGDPTSTTLLTTIVSAGEAYVYADVDEATFLAFTRLSKEGGIATENGRVPVEMQLTDENDFPHRGYVESSDNRLDSNSGSLVLRMVFPNPQGLLIPGLFARVHLPVSAPKATLLISERAIGTDQSQKFVLTVDDKNTAAYRKVTLGPLIEGKRIVRSGLEAGERIIVNGLQRTKPGMTVSPEAAPSASSVAMQ